MHYISILILCFIKKKDRFSPTNEKDSIQETNISREITTRVNLQLIGGDCQLAKVASTAVID